MLKKAVIISSLFPAISFGHGFIAGTPIRTVDVDSYKSIDQIKAGDEVLSCDTEYYNPQKVLSDSKVYGTIDIYNIETKEGDSIYASKLQQFYVLNKGWVAAADIYVGNRVIHSNLGAIEITYVHKIRRPQVTYVIEVDHNHGYFPVGLLSKSY